MERIDVKDVQQ
ncbi:Protein of unknown function [Bacillus cytotoxicus]|uniref:Uncharacterized protein n=1 Tax=Bacillus cytotoxicus TaxID=580165 RepID=A0AAX2CFL4_9BACI|nr:Protein of unknown function [Bacillus cytotoxicus]